MTVKLREKEQKIQRLQAQVQIQLSQQSIAQGLTDTIIARGQALQAKFNNQAQDFVILQQIYNQQAEILANLNARLNQKSYELSNCERQPDIRSAELREMSEGLKKATKEEVSSLHRESEQKSVELNEGNGKLGKKSEKIEKLREERHHDSKKLSN